MKTVMLLFGLVTIFLGCRPTKPIGEAQGVRKTAVIVQRLRSDKEAPYAPQESPLGDDKNGYWDRVWGLVENEFDLAGELGLFDVSPENDEQAEEAKGGGTGWLRQSISEELSKLEAKSEGAKLHVVSRILVFHYPTGKFPSEFFGFNAFQLNCGIRGLDCDAGPLLFAAEDDPRAYALAMGFVPDAKVDYVTCEAVMLIAMISPKSKTGEQAPNKSLGLIHASFELRDGKWLRIK